MFITSARERRISEASTVLHVVPWGAEKLSHPKRIWQATWWRIPSPKFSQDHRGAVGPWNSFIVQRCFCLTIWGSKWIQMTMKLETSAESRRISMDNYFPQNRNSCEGSKKWFHQLDPPRGAKRIRKGAIFRTPLRLLALEGASIYILHKYKHTFWFIYKDINKYIYIYTYNIYIFQYTLRYIYI